MANKTLQQVRTDYPAVLPIEPAQCLILDQQIDQPAGEQSTAATAAEIIATGGTVVETAVSYEALYADEKVIATASSITLSIASNMRVGARKTFWRTASYDGNPVTITPPSGATIEGLSSIELYGQYSYVELERISSTVFAIVDFLDKATTSLGTWVATKGFVLKQWGNVGPFTADSLTTCNFPRPFSTRTSHSFSGSVVPIAEYQPFYGYSSEVNTFKIYTARNANIFDWYAIGSWG